VNVPTAAQVYTVNQARVATADAGLAKVDERVDAQKGAFSKVTPTLSPEPGKTLENVIGKQPSTGKALIDGAVEAYVPNWLKKK